MLDMVILATILTWDVCVAGRAYIWEERMWACIVMTDNNLLGNMIGESARLVSTYIDSVYYYYYGISRCLY